MILELIRLETGKFGTLGILKIDKKIFCCTLEPPDKENKQNISCIPTGQYTCKRYSSAKYPDTFQIMNVTDRTKCLFHAGNDKDDTAGCVLLGQYFGKLKSYDRAVLNSGNTFKVFINTLKDDEVHLTITENY